ncbi:uncharacterized protein BO95DRAFT_504917 [Aspergillus brunneoviolaceus CBS 621.78]|uniref:Uncharacterized protein n=1 Tax=Aspergillus brunneoviolaceus CBS 621.78 TaxID=1450534 RepID=A0ACD1GKG1_9EURO|nr:hypothetical protein BO95DRAFT_504917 [Aspergillus brunneoviolaceus CBS 621.78]RAH49737.1 hypothetical protein BO95DRAFT_504917 [Aspergillus brunneoviolaceus CBS 621.78]
METSLSSVYRLEELARFDRPRCTNNSWASQSSCLETPLQNPPLDKNQPFMQEKKTILDPIDHLGCHTNSLGDQVRHTAGVQRDIGTQSAKLSEKLQRSWPLLPNHPQEFQRFDDYESVPSFSSRPDQKLWTYQIRNGADRAWRPCYAFSDLEFHPRDLEVMNFYTSQFPGSFLTTRVLAIRFLARDSHIYGKVVLDQNKVKVNTGGKSVLVQTCVTEAEGVEVLSTRAVRRCLGGGAAAGDAREKLRNNLWWCGLKVLDGTELEWGGVGRERSSVVGWYGVPLATSSAFSSRIDHTTKLTILPGSI